MNATEKERVIGYVRRIKGLAIASNVVSWSFVAVTLINLLLTWRVLVGTESDN